MRSLNGGKIIPWHVQLNPCNSCNFHCGFCGCSNRDKDAMMPYSEMEEMIRLFRSLGMSCVTITGGGEPILYPHLPKLLKLLHKLKVEVGLVTNGSLLHKLSVADLNRVRWCRISCSDELPQQINIEKWLASVDSAVIKDSCIDWAFSYVLSRTPNFLLLKKIIDYANVHEFTHVRVVSDLFDLASVPEMSVIREELLRLGVDVNCVIFQGRKKYLVGGKPCYISLLKPVVGADGSLYPCCSIQYSEETPSRDYGESMCMGNWRDLPKLIEKQQFFNGEKCIRCYYGEYQYLGELVKPLEHMEFV